MKLLFITQKVDLDDSVLGVYHTWITKLSKRLDKLTVICLYEGRKDLPENIRTFSLGKEQGQSRIKYIYRFFSYVFSLRLDYDAVLVHMNPFYILLGGWLWKLWRKKIFMWYNHPWGNITTRIGILFSDKVFCTSAYSFAARCPRAVLMPVGVDVSLFQPLPDIKRKPNRILYLGRISPIKKLEYLVAAAKTLDAAGVGFELLIVGDPMSDRDREYQVNLEKAAGELLARGRIVFMRSIPNHKTPSLYNSSDVFVNLTPTGSLDKTTFEAMACETLVLVSNKVFRELLPEYLRELCLFEEGNVEDCTTKMQKLFTLNEPGKKRLGQELRSLVVAKHSLDALVLKLVQALDYENK